MAIGRGTKKGKGGKRKVDAMSRKEWYDVVAPAVFQSDKRQFCKTLVNRTVGLKRAEDNLKGRIFEVNLADLTGDEASGHRKMQLRCDHVQGRNCLTNFHGMSLTRDKLASLVKKRCSLIEARAQCATSDGYLLAVFIIGFTARAKAQQSKNAYAQTTQIKALRRRMIEQTTKAIKQVDLQGALKKFMSDLPAAELPKQCVDIFPLRDVYIRKVRCDIHASFACLRVHCCAGVVIAVGVGVFCCMVVCLCLRGCWLLRKCLL